MRIVLAVLTAIAVAVGCLAFASAKSVVHEVFGAVCFVAAAVMLSVLSILEGLRQACQKLDVLAALLQRTAEAGEAAAELLRRAVKPRKAP